jgi:ribosomal protein S18
MPPSGREKTRTKRDEYYRDRRRRKVCTFCADKTVMIDYKEVNRLRRYLSERAVLARVRSRTFAPVLAAASS